MEKPFSDYSGDDPYVFRCYAYDDAAVVYPEIKNWRLAFRHLQKFANGAPVSCGCRDTQQIFHALRKL